MKKVSDGPSLRVQRPRYRQLTDALRARIDAGEWTSGQPLPTARALCEEYGVSQTTLDRALRLLDGLGYLQRGTGGRLTVAPTHRRSEQLWVELPLEILERTSGPIEVEILGRAAADEQHAEVRVLLDLAPADTLIVERRLLRSRGIVVATDEWYYTDPLARRLARRPAAEVLPWAWLEREFRARPITADRVLTASAVDAADATLLALLPGEAVLVLEERFAVEGPGLALALFARTTIPASRGACQLHARLNQAS